MKNKQKQVWTHEDISHIIGADNVVLKFDLKNKADFERMENAMRTMLIAKGDDGKNVPNQSLENKYVITRYFRDDKNDKKQDVRYFVFEKI